MQNLALHRASLSLTVPYFSPDSLSRKLHLSGRRPPSSPCSSPVVAFTQRAGLFSRKQGERKILGVPGKGRMGVEWCKNNAQSDGAPQSDGAQLENLCNSMRSQTGGKLGVAQNSGKPWKWAAWSS